MRAQDHTRRRRRLRVAAVAAVAVCTSVTACSSSHGRDELRQQLTTGVDAFSQQQADCIVAGLEQTGTDAGVYNNPGDYDPATVQTMSSILERCVVEQPPTPGTAAGPPGSAG